MTRDTDHRPDDELAALRARIAELERADGRSPVPAPGSDAAAADPYRELFERSADAILILEGGRFVDCNDATVRMLRCSDRREVLETHPSELSPPTQPDGRDSRTKADEMIAIALAHGSHRFEWDHRRADGEVFPVEVLLTAVERHGRQILHVVWRDVTDRKRLEEQLRHSQKMEAVGQLAGGIAHDFNNLLVGIIGRSDILSAALADRPDLAEHVHQIQRSGDRAAALVRQLLAFSRRQPTHTRVVDLNRALAQVEQLLRPLIREDIRLFTVPSPTPLRVRADPGQIEQVIANVATNARDAMPRGGTLCFRLDVVELGAGDPELPPGRYAHLTASDTGTGMDATTAARAFEPFFTTKDVGRGSGLGLALAYGIVHRAGGSIRIDSRPGEGATVDIRLPLTDEAETEEIRPSGPSAAGGSRTVMVVEDEPIVADLVVELLTGSGYRVLHAPDGLAALELWREHGRDVDLLLTDVVMPNVGGPELVEELLGAGHRPHVLFMSGYAREDLGHFEARHGPVALLEKPFSAARLLEAVRARLETPPR